MPSTEETEQEAFWRGEFGAEYARRNADESIVRSNFAFFARAKSSAFCVPTEPTRIVSIGNFR